MSFHVDDLQDIISKKFTRNTLTDIIRNETGFNEVAVKSIEFGEEFKKGDSYLSAISRFTVTATNIKKPEDDDVKIHIIVKCLPKNLGRRKTFRSIVFFENETIFYEKVWPALYNFQVSKIKNSSIGDVNNTTLFNNIPKLYSAVTDGENDYIAMEDLRYKGYESAARADGLNYDQTVDILRLFAQFHALSLAFKDQQPDEFERIATTLKEVYFTEKYRSWYHGFQQSLYVVIRDALEKELPLHYLAKFNQLIADDYFGRLCELCEVRGPLSVVTHGDTWIPNFLFKFEQNDASKSQERRLLDTVMIDFQLARYTSLSNDITFFFLCCTDTNVLAAHWDDLIVAYHEALMVRLEQLGSARNLVSLAALRDNVKSSMPYAIAMTMENLTMALLDQSDVPDLDLIQGDDAVPIETMWTAYPYKEQSKRKRLASVIQIAVDKELI